MDRWHEAGLLTAGQRKRTTRNRVWRKWLRWSTRRGRPGLHAIAPAGPTMILAAGAAAVLAASLGAARASAQTSTTITNLTPAIVATPELRLASMQYSADQVKLNLACTFAACEVAANLTTVEHLNSRGTTKLTAAGAGKNTKAVVIGSVQLARILPGQSSTLTVRLNGTGQRLLDSFQTMPASVTVELANGAPMTKIHRALTVTRG